MSQSVSADGPPPARRRPMAVARRVALFRREIREWISPPALDILLRAADLITEGAFEGEAGDEQVYLGSVQVTVDLHRAAAYIREPLDAAAARQLAHHLHTDTVARQLLEELARRESEHAAGCPLYGLQVEIDPRYEGDALHVTLDVEAQTHPIAGAERGGTP